MTRAFAIVAVTTLALSAAACREPVDPSSKASAPPSTAARTTVATNGATPPVPNSPPSAPVLRPAPDGGSRVPSSSIPPSLPQDGGDQPSEPADPPLQLLTGEQAQEVIAAGAPSTEIVVDGGAPLPKQPPDATPGLPAFLIGANSVGPYQLDASRTDLQTIAGAPLNLRPVRRRSAGNEQFTEEVATWRGPDGLRMELWLEGGRLRAIHIIAGSPAAVTERNLGIGATLAELMEQYGDPRPHIGARGRPDGWVLEDIPGIVFAPTDPAAVLIEPPLQTARIVSIWVVGPEQTP